MFLGMFGSIFLLSQFLQGVVGYSPTEAGLRMLPWTGMPMLVAPDRRHPLRPHRRPPGRRHRPRPPGRGPRATSPLVLEPGVSYAAQLPPLILSGIGMALYFAPAASLVMSSVRPAEQGIASGANNALREVGGALGIAVLGSVFAAQGGYEIRGRLHRRHRARHSGSARRRWPSRRCARPAHPGPPHGPGGAGASGRSGHGLARPDAWSSPQAVAGEPARTRGPWPPPGGGPRPVPLSPCRNSTTPPSPR